MVSIRRSFFLPLLYILIFGGFIYAYSNNAQVQQTTDITIHNVQALTYRGIAKLTGNKPTELKQQDDNPRQSTTGINNARWPQNTATVYLNINNRILKAATINALAQWNHSRAFIFRQVNSQTNANIIVTTMDTSNGAAGLTNVTTNLLTGYFNHATVQLNIAYLLNPAYGYSQQRIINTAEHELGHAIGLHHTNQPSVMQPAGSYYSIQPQNIQDVEKLYATKPTVQN